MKLTPEQSAALIDLRKAFLDTLEAFEGSELPGEYPFSKSFDELTVSVMVWVDAAVDE